MQKIEVPVISNKNCSDAYGFIRKISKGMMCAGHKDGGYGVCVVIYIIKFHKIFKLER